MKYEISWRAFLRVKKGIKAKKLINQIESIIGQNVMNVSVDNGFSSRISS